MSAPERLSWSNYGLLVGYCLVLFSFPLLNGRVLTTHETVHCQNAREMRADGDWIIPHYGGRPWVERPPLPFWITNAVVEMCGDRPFSYRLAALLMGLPCVLLVAWMASLWFGRGIGLMSGLILATMQEFTHYSTGPEADIFLCLIVTAAMALFVYLEFRCRGTDETEDVRFLGQRPWPVLTFFIVLGLTNLVKGLFFGTLFVLLPVGCFLIATANVRALRRYLWLWGWLACLAVAVAWPVAAYLRYPDILDFWKSDYLGRVNQGYMREPFWYYFAQLPIVIFPWTLPAFLGLWLSRGSALREKSSSQRFLWFWAIVPILFFSIPEGKHHHYLLQCLAPWAVLAALGIVRIWQYVQRLLDEPWQQRGRLAMGSLCVALIALYWAMYSFRTNYLDNYRDDSAFLAQAAAAVPGGKPLLVMDDDAPLNASWLLFYLEGRATLLHNLTFLVDDHIAQQEVYLIARRKVDQSLEHFGSYEVLLASKHSRYENSPADRYALFRLRFHERLARLHGPVRISPMQATGRAPGPYLCSLDTPAHNGP
jgi:4-amino-4-deoxy-L-arabinose transferase-like glycosyltransferase